MEYALPLIREVRPVIVLLELDLPDGDGLRLLRAIHQDTLCGDRAWFLDEVPHSWTRCSQVGRYRRPETAQTAPTSGEPG